MSSAFSVPSQPQNPAHIRPVEIPVTLDQLRFGAAQGRFKLLPAQCIHFARPLPSGQPDGFLIRPLHGEAMPVDQLQPVEEQNRFALLLLAEPITSARVRSLDRRVVAGLQIVRHALNDAVDLAHLCHWHLAAGCFEDPG